jgi:hypothetical protein
MSMVLKLLSYATLPAAMAYWLWVLAGLTRRIRRAKLVILPRMAKNFGYTVITPDTARRLWPGQALYILTWEPYGTQNPTVAEMWRDVDVQARRRPSLMTIWKGRRVRLPDHGLAEPLAFLLTKYFIALVSSSTKLLDMEDVYSEGREQFPPALLDAVERDTVQPDGAFQSNAMWGSLVMTRPAPPIRFKDDIRRDFLGAIEAKTGTSNRPLCALHVRVDTVIDNHSRNGSGIEAWGGAMRLLTERGYTVVLSGDEKPTSKIDFVLDESDLDIARDLFRLLAVSEAAVFIGDSGAGGLISSANGIPVLIFNAYPLMSSPPRSWNVPKSLLATDYPDAGFTEILRMYPFAPFKNGDAAVIAQTNPAGLIRATTTWFLDALETDRLAEEPVSTTEEDIRAVLPGYCLFLTGGARIAPTWDPDTQDTGLAPTASARVLS